MKSFIIYYYLLLALSNNLFPNCQFRYGRDYVDDSTDYSQYDYITIWIDTISSTCAQSNAQVLSCTDFNKYYQGAMLKKVKSLQKIALFYGGLWIEFMKFFNSI